MLMLALLPLLETLSSLRLVSEILQYAWNARGIPRPADLPSPAHLLMTTLLRALLPLGVLATVAVALATGRRWIGWTGLTVYLLWGLYRAWAFWTSMA